MPFIKPRTRGKYLYKVVARLDADNYETLYAYAAFIDEGVDYVVNELVDAVLAHNKQFLAWRADHQESYVPSQRSSPRRGASRRARTPGTPDPRV